LMWYSKITPLEGLQFNRGKQVAMFILAAIVLMLIQLPLINGLAELNKALHLPESMQGLERWMHEKEDAAARITEVFLTMPTFADYLFAMIIMAVVPALGEELLFRGALQPLLTGLTGKHHLAIWITAF